MKEVFRYGKCIFARPNINQVDEMVEMVDNELISSMLSTKKRIITKEMEIEWIKEYQEGNTFSVFDSESLDYIGNFDLSLIRPENIILQILGSDIGLTKISRVVGFIIILIYSLIAINFNFTTINIVILLYTIFSSVIFYGSVYLIGASLSFFFIEGIELINILSSGTREIGEYPMGVYGKKVLKFFTFIVPIVCLNYYPVMYMLGYSNNLLFALSPVVAILFLIPASILFKFGLNKYQSTGS